MKDAERRGPRKHADWVLLFRLDADSWLGMSADELYIGSESEPRRVVEIASPVGLLSLLEHSPDEVTSALAAREAELGLVEGELARRIPLEYVPRVAVDTHMDYWVQLALDSWEANNAFHADPSVLEAVVTADWATQRARHRAGKLAKS